MKIYQLYLSLLKKYGAPRDFWKKWCKRDKNKRDQEEIALGAILTQRTSWQNVELALKNLQRENILSIKGVYQVGKKNLEMLERLIRPSGFYKQKAKRLFRFCEFIIKNSTSLEKFFNQDLEICRKQLLEISGIGPETADSILLYGGDKPIFVIDEYTRRFVKKYKITDKVSYDHLQKLFQKNLPRNVKIYQDFHAMIVLEGRGTGWDLKSPIEQKTIKI
jgi:endonuclease-3 related protein